MKTIKLLLNLANWAILVGISFFALYIISSNFSVLGKYRSFLVQSGSMEPAIMTGDIIVTETKENYFKNDTVTFRNNSERIITHRIVGIEEGRGKKFSTKGDANVTGDEDNIDSSQIIGRVFLVIPKIGYLVSFAKSPSGLIFLLLIPATIFILDELIKINKNFESEN